MNPELNYMLLFRQDLSDLNPVFLGETATPKGYQGSFDARNCYAIGRVLSGRGTIYIDGVGHDVHGGQFFLIPIGNLVQVHSDQEDPWHYIYIGFRGTLARDFLQLPTVFDVPEDVIPRLHMPPNAL